jgi:membrane protease YdiL (CAAX protease family)
MHLTDLFIDRHKELRVGWRLLSFFVLVAIGLLALALPLKMLGARGDLVGRLVGLAATLGASYAMTRFVNKKPFGAIGLSLHRNMFREFGIGCLLGFLMISGIFILELMSGYISVVWRGYSFLECVKVLGFSLVSFAIAAFLEEVFFRGYAFQTLIQWVTFLPSMLVFSVFFAFSHYANPNITTLSVVNIALAGIWLSIAYMKTRSLWLPFGLHVSWNFSQTSLYSFPTSGGSLSDQRLSDLVQTGPEWITGGAFGPEGGILATLALILGTWFILKSRYLSAPEGIITLDSVEDLLPKPAGLEERSA